MFYFILGGAFIISAIIPVLLLAFNHADKHICVGSLIATLIGGALLFLAGHALRFEAKQTYNELLEQKQFIEQNYSDTDILTQWQVHDEYFKYMFKYEQIMESYESGIMSGYWGMDIKMLKLNIGR